MKNNNNFIWNAYEYNNNSSIQEEAANYILKLINLKGSEKILDIGCGDGKITADIAKNLTTGSIIGLDLSQEMIEFAKTKHFQKNLSFFLQDVQEINFINSFNIIFSSFSIQWIKNKKLLFQKISKALLPTGQFIATIPLGISNILEKAIDKIISLPKWHFFFNSMHKINFRNPKYYKKLLDDFSFYIDHFSVVFQEFIFPSRERFEKYVIQWFSYLNYLPLRLRPDFFKQVLDQYIEFEPLLTNGKVKFTFPRLDFITKKIIY